MEQWCRNPCVYSGPVPRCLLVFEPPDGGVAENVMRLALGLGSHGWEIRVAGPRRSTVYPALERAGIPIARIPLERGYGHPLRDAGALGGLLRILARGRFDLVHAHSARAGVLARTAAALTSTAVVYSPHCFPFVGPWRLPRRQFATAVERMLGPLTDAIICVAEEERSLALGHRLVASERLHVVHNGCEPCDEDLAPDPELEAFSGEGPLAACLTVLRPQKAVHVFVEAAALVLEHMPEARLAVIGDGDLREPLERRAAELALGPRLRFLPFRPPASRQLRSIDVFVLPSAWEAFPISVLEAMACGVPQVATDVGGTSEAVDDGDTGLLCPPGSPPALAERILTLLGDPARCGRMGERSRSRHESRFRVEGMVERTAAVYEAVAERPRRRAVSRRARAGSDRAS